jgi:hypothetical protein
MAQAVRAGLLIHDVAPLWGNTRQERGADLNLEFTAGGPWPIRPLAGVSINTAGHTSQLYAGLVYEYQPGRFNFGLAAGGAIHTGALASSTTRSLGSRLIFRIALEIGYELQPGQELSIYLAHISNAGLADHNAGLDTLGLRWTWRL